MLNLPTGFASMAVRLSTAMGAPFYDAFIVRQTDAVFDDGGSIVTPGGVDRAPCKVQIDLATEAMRLQDGWTDKDYRFIILAATIGAGDASGVVPVLDTDARVEVSGGPRMGAWSVSSLQMDPAGVGYVGRGRLV